MWNIIHSRMASIVIQTEYSVWTGYVYVDIKLTLAT